MRAAALLVCLLLTNTAFVGDAPRITAGRQPRAVRVVETAPAPAGWSATRDRDTGMTVSLWGGAVDVPGALVDAAIAERAARDFIGLHVAPGSTVAVAGNRVSRTRRTLVFHQQHGSLRVAGATIAVVFERDRLIAVTSSAVSPASLSKLPTLPGATTATHARATSTSIAWLHADGINASLRPTGERVVLPIVHGRDLIALHVADVLDARAGSGDRWTIYVATDGTPLLRARSTRHGASTLRLDVPVRHPASTRTLVPAARMNLTVNGGATQTDDAGGFTWNGNAPSTVVTTATGALVQVIDAGGGATSTLTGNNGGATDWSLAGVAGDDAQITAYAHVMAAKARARQIHPSLAWLDQTQQVFVNEAGACNAFSTGDDIHFFAAGPTCENTARIVDIVLHEFGHSFHVQSHLAGDIDDSLAEGVADFFAANLVDDSGIGRGLHFDDVPVRELDPPGFERRFPEDVGGSVHQTGLIIGGALWDLRTALIAELGQVAGVIATERVYLGVLEHAADLATSYQAALLGDDDDGDLGNGTPHLCAIEKAFAAHGLVPDFAETTLSTPAVDGRRISTTVTVPVGRTCAPAVVTGVDLVVDLPAGGTEIIPMTLDGATYAAELPPVAGPTVITYSVVARLDSDEVRSFPQNAADPRYQLFLGTATPIWCDRLDAMPAWQQTGDVIWEWARPFGRAGDPPATFTGEAFLGTNIIGSGRYLADSSTAITTPMIDASEHTGIHLQFRRWLTVDDRAFDLAGIAVNGEPVWSNAADVQHVDREWRFVDIPLPPDLEQDQLAITWSLESNTTTELGGWNLDDICVVAFEGEACTTPDCLDPPDEGGCCSSSDGRGSALLAGVVLFGVFGRRRGRR